jgi:ubiquitin C-terminal hydrolase
MSKAIELSMQDATGAYVEAAETNIRVSGITIGLKNVGNTCYFNSLL